MLDLPRPRVWRQKLWTIVQPVARNRPLIEVVPGWKVAHVHKQIVRESQTSNEEKIDHAAGSRNGKYLERLSGLSLQRNPDCVAGQRDGRGVPKHTVIDHIGRYIRIPPIAQ